MCRDETRTSNELPPKRPDSGWQRCVSSTRGLRSMTSGRRVLPSTRAVDRARLHGAEVPGPFACAPRRHRSRRSIRVHRQQDVRRGDEADMNRSGSRHHRAAIGVESWNQRGRSRTPVGPIGVDLGPPGIAGARLHVPASPARSLLSRQGLQQLDSVSERVVGVHPVVALQRLVINDPDPDLVQ